ncbi:MAG: chemotaxis protein CheW [Anaerolineae bacterium]
MKPISGSSTFEGDTLHTVLTFRLERQVYALPIAPIVQLIEMVSIVPLPQMHNGIEGLINVRGTMTPVVSLRHYVGLRKQPWSLHTPIILMRMAGNRMVGLIVDEVLEVITLRDVPAPPSSFLPTGLQVAQMLLGVAYQNGQTILLLDHEALFTKAQAQALIQASEHTDDEDGSDKAGAVATAA